MIKLLKKYVLIKNDKNDVTKSGIILASQNEVKDQGIIEGLGPDCPIELEKGQMSQLCPLEIELESEKEIELDNCL